MKYEYGIIFKSDEDTLKSEYPEIHRWGYTENEAIEWIKDWIEMGGKEDTYKIVKRLISPWEVV